MLKRLLIISLLAMFVLSCSGRRPKETMSAKERLTYAMKKFKNGDYLDAKTEFRVIVLNFPGQSVVDTAQFYLAECHLKMKEYILAAAEYEKLIRMFPASKFTDDAQYKIGYANYELSPKYSLDQTYTLKAIDELQRFAEEYPTSDLVNEANKLMLKCREKLAKKEYKTGELYRKMSYYEAAILYFESVLSNYYDTDYAEDAQFWLAECLRKDRDYGRAVEEYAKYLQKYPNSNRKSQVQALLKDAQRSKEATGTSSDGMKEETASN
ncbi:outer membrane protein assembly factor BamD [candidate division KSB1 bacterium]|nr:outer membrane protein assembly factor BamD [candidate division KSB1 bacterium]